MPSPPPAQPSRLLPAPEARVQPGFLAAAHALLAALVRDGAALGWTEPPPYDEVAALLDTVCGEAAQGDAALWTAYDGPALRGLGWWRRYSRPTHRPHADLEKLAVHPAASGRGLGRALTEALVSEARAAGIEVLTLDARGDNTRALHLYRSLGFSEYGRLPAFVAVGTRRYDKVFCAYDLRTPPDPAHRTLARVVRTRAASPAQWDAWTPEGQYLLLHYRRGSGTVERHPGPDPDQWTEESWNEGRSAVLATWDDGTGGSTIGLPAFLAASGITLAPDAEISEAS
ncbi:N-acetyltransferase family protein [Streptomyces sp. NPDC001054]